MGEDYVEFISFSAKSLKYVKRKCSCKCSISGENEKEKAWGRGGGGGGGATPLYQVYRYVPPQRVWFLSRFSLKTGIDLNILV